MNENRSRHPEEVSSNKRTVTVFRMEGMMTEGNTETQGSLFQKSNFMFLHVDLEF